MTEPPRKVSTISEFDEDDYESLPPTATTSQTMFAGALAGVMEHCIIYPVDVIKTRMQCLKPDPGARYTGIVDAFTKIVTNEGIRRPFRGMSVVVIGAGPAHALYFSCYESIKKNFSGASRAGDNMIVNGIAGCFSTLLHDSVMVPSDVIKQRLQMYNSPYKGVIDCATKTIRNEGFSALYKSYFTQLSMNIPFQVTHLVTYDFLQKNFNPTREYSPLTHCLSGACAGAFAAAITTPLDVCKTLINTQECCNPEEHCKNVTSNNPVSNSIKMRLNPLFVRSSSTATPIRASGLKDAITIIYRSEGFRGFSKGLMPRTVFQVPGTAISWSVYEYFKHVFIPPHATEH